MAVSISWFKAESSQLTFCFLGSDLEGGIHLEADFLVENTKL